MIKDSPNPPSDSTEVNTAVRRAINHYLNPPDKPAQSADSNGLFTLRDGLDTETILINASEDLASVQALAGNLAFQIDGTPRNVALGICRMLEGVQLLVDEAVNQYERDLNR